MYISRSEILPGVWLSHLRLEKAKSACLSITLLGQLSRETAAQRALIPYVLRRGTAELDDTDKLASGLEELGGASIEPLVRRVGEIQCLGFYADIPSPDKLDGLAHLVCRMLLHPITRGGLLLQRYVDSERARLISAIEERSRDAVRRCLAEMCCSEDYAVDPMGDPGEVSGLSYVKLTRAYHDLLLQSPVEIIYCGPEREEKVLDILRDALVGFPRGELDDSIGTDLRLNALEDEPRFIREEADVPCGTLVMGFRLGEVMLEPDEAAVAVFTRLMGEGASCDVHKGILLVSAQTEADSCESAKEAVLERLEALRRGEIEDSALERAKAELCASLMSLGDDMRALEGFVLEQIVDGLDYGTDELAALIEDVTADELSQIACSLECDLIYFLSGDGCEDDGSEPEETIPDEEMLNQ